MIEVIQGDILEQKGDAIVNPANNQLMHGGGLAGIIERAAAPVAKVGMTLGEDAKIDQWLEDHDRAPIVVTGDAYVTSAGLLPYKGVIHVVGPIWKDGTFCEPALLESAHRMAFWYTNHHKWKSVLVPAISCGIFMYPVERAAPVALLAAAQWPDLDITFVLFEDEHYEAYCKASKRLKR